MADKLFALVIILGAIFMVLIWMDSCVGCVAGEENMRGPLQHTIIRKLHP